MPLITKPFFRDIWVVAALLGSLGALIGTTIQIENSVRPGAGLIFLHLSIVSGVNLTGTWQHLYYIPGAAAVVWLLNLLWLSRRYPEDPTASRIIAAVSLLMAFGMWWGVHLLLSVNG